MNAPTRTAERVARIRQILCEVLDIDEASLRDDASFAEDLFVDSLLAMEVMAAVEDAFQIEIDAETLLGIETPADLYRAIASFTEG